MDFLVFLDSACALHSYFSAVTAYAFRSPLPAHRLLAGARPIGAAAEETMLAATNGVNTHKGAIFSLGLACMAAGRLCAEGKPLSPKALLALAGQMAAETPAELEAAAQKGPRTHGEEQYLRHGLTGIRGEAAAGFPSVRAAGFPVLKALLEQGVSSNDAGVIALLHLMARVEDSNVVRRAGLARQRELAAEIGAFLARESDPAKHIAYAADLDRRFIAENISPGGSADLLALCWLLYFLA